MRDGSRSATEHGSRSPRASRAARRRARARDDAGRWGGPHGPHPRRPPGDRSRVRSDARRSRSRLRSTGCRRPSRPAARPTSTRSARRSTPCRASSASAPSTTCRSPATSGASASKSTADPRCSLRSDPAPPGASCGRAISRRCGSRSADATSTGATRAPACPSPSSTRRWRRRTGPGRDPIGSRIRIGSDRGRAVDDDRRRHGERAAVRVVGTGARGALRAVRAARDRVRRRGAHVRPADGRGPGARSPARRAARYGASIRSCPWRAS